MVEGTCLENKQGESSRGFKSYFLRHKSNRAPSKGPFSCPGIARDLNRKRKPCDSLYVAGFYLASQGWFFYASVGFASSPWLRASKYFDMV